MGRLGLVWVGVKVHGRGGVREAETKAGFKFSCNISSTKSIFEDFIYLPPLTVKLKFQKINIRNTSNIFELPFWPFSIFTIWQHSPTYSQAQ